MTVRVLFFGAAADLAGTRQAEVEVAAGMTAGELVESLKSKHPGLAGQKLLFAVNEEYADPATPLQNGSEVAIFTPVSGG